MILYTESSRHLSRKKPVRHSHGKDQVKWTSLFDVCWLPSKPLHMGNRSPAPLSTKWSSSTLISYDWESTSPVADYFMFQISVNFNKSSRIAVMTARLSALCSQPYDERNYIDQVKWCLMLIIINLIAWKFSDWSHLS